MKSLAGLIAVAVLSIGFAGCGPTGPTKPGTSPRDAEKVREWGLSHGWKEVTPKPTTQQQDEQSTARGTGAGDVEADRPYRPTAEERSRGLLVFTPDRNRFRLRDQAPSVGEMGGPIEVTGLLGECESLPVMVYALSDLPSVSLTVSELRRLGMTPIPASDVQVREVVYAPLSLRNTRAKENRFQMWPMWLVPPRPEPLKAGQGRMFWVTIRNPKEADTSHHYRGLMTVQGGKWDFQAFIDLDVRQIKLDTSLCSWVPVVGGNSFTEPALFRQLAEHHMTGLSWWWGDYGLRVRKEGQGEAARAAIDPTELDKLNDATRAAGMVNPDGSRGPWILFLGNMIRGHLELRLAGKYKDRTEPALFPVKIAVIPNTKKTGVQPSSMPSVADLSDSAEMDRRYVEVLQSLASRAKEKGYPQIIICPYDEPTKYLSKHNAHWCDLIHQHVPEIKTLNTPQGSLAWAKNLMPYTDYMDVQGADDEIYDATVKAGKGFIGYSRLTSNQTFAQARYDMGLRFARQQATVIYFWSLNFGHGTPATPFNDLIDGDSAARHQFAWPPEKPGQPWVETLVWEAQREGAKDYLLTLMVQRELDKPALRDNAKATQIRAEFEKFKADASMHPTRLDQRREQLVKWMEELASVTGK